MSEIISEVISETMPDTKSEIVNKLDNKKANATFKDLVLDKQVLKSLDELGYETPTPIQIKSIPVLLDGKDLLAQAQTGTGKTAAFALPIIPNIDIDIKHPQALIIAPTRELAIQVAEAFKSYAKYLKGFNVTSIYGGQDYSTQLKALKRGSHVIVGTPGRVMDHIRRGSLSLQHIKTVVLDEADEMLKMGFIDDIQWIFDQIEHNHQIALFSATMPREIQNVAKKYLKNSEEIKIEAKTVTVDAIEQYYISLPRAQKFEVLNRYLEVEEVDAAIIFSRTKSFSTEIAEKLQTRGYSAAALNGDMSQSMREKVIDRMKAGHLNIIVATDVAARGIDIPRVTHVINFDIPHDAEAYVHRIGRTGRAGRTGKALLFLTPRENNLLRNIERALKSKIIKTDPPSIKEVNDKREKQLVEKVVKVLEKGKRFKQFYGLVETIAQQGNYSPEDIAAAFASLMQSNGSASAESSGLDSLLSDFKDDGKSQGQGGSRRSRARGQSHGHSNRRDSGYSSDRADRGERRSGGGSRRASSQEGGRGYRGKSGGSSSRRGDGQSSSYEGGRSSRGKSGGSSRSGDSHDRGYQRGTDAKKKSFNKTKSAKKVSLESRGKRF